MSNSNKRHAYLLIAHKNDSTLKHLLKSIDHPLNDIYLHMDKDTLDYDEKEMMGILNHSDITFVERKSLAWGGFSLVSVEMFLMKTAIKKAPYAFYHLLSGEDLPLKSQDDIHTFFDKHKNKEFVHFIENAEEYKFRVKYYHLFQEKIGRAEGFFFRIINKLLIKIQSLIGVNRNKNIQFKMGSQWFSITEKLVLLVLSQEEWIIKTFRYTLCADELYLQTIIYKSDFTKNLYEIPGTDEINSILRYIDWERGAPYTFTVKDYEELITSKALFARKFDVNVDKNIINKLTN